MTRKDVKGDQPSGGEPKTGSFGDDMLRHSPNHGTQRLPNDDDDDDDEPHKKGILAGFPKKLKACLS